MDALNEEIKNILEQVIDALGQVIGAIDASSPNQSTETDEDATGVESDGLLPSGFIPTREVSQFLPQKEG